jgi:hypothetical protein
MTSQVKRNNVVSQSEIKENVIDTESRIQLLENNIAKLEGKFARFVTRYNTTPARLIDNPSPEPPPYQS